MSQNLSRDRRLAWQAAIEGIDFNTLGLLTGMMIIVAITRQSGIFEYLAIWSVKRVNADPWWILVALVLVTAVLSALLDNVTTVLLIVPVTLNVINLRPNSLFCRKISSIHHHLKESEMNSVPAVPTTDQAVLPKII